MLIKTVAHHVRGRFTWAVVSIREALQSSVKNTEVASNYQVFFFFFNNNDSIKSIKTSVLYTIRYKSYDQIIDASILKLSDSMHAIQAPVGRTDSGSVPGWCNLVKNLQKEK